MESGSSVLATAPGGIGAAPFQTLVIIVATYQRLIVMQHTFMGHVTRASRYPYSAITGWKVRTWWPLEGVYWTTNDLKRHEVRSVPRKLLQRLRDTVEPLLPPEALEEPKGP